MGSTPQLKYVANYYFSASCPKKKDNHHLSTFSIAFNTLFMLISLKKEALSVLRSCGWADEVYSFMRSRKRLCMEQVGTTRNGDEAK